MGASPNPIMIIQILDQPITQINCDALVLYLYSVSRPPKETAGTVDWYMNGFISRLIKAGKITCAHSEIVMVATQGRMIAPRALLLGFGNPPEVKLNDIMLLWKQAALNLCFTDNYHIAASIPYVKEWKWSTYDTVDMMMQGLLSGIADAGKNIRDFKLHLTNFAGLKTKENKDQARLSLKSIKEVSLIGY